MTLRDVNGVQSTISIGAYGGGIEEPYQRSGSLSGSGVGWHNEMETVRIRLTDFLADSSGINMELVQAVRFDFGEQGVSPVGRQGMDDIELTRD